MKLGGASVEEIAIAAQKHTEVLRIAPGSVSPGLYLDPFPTEGASNEQVARSHGIRAAYYSAAFLFQRILADRLDVDPQEIEVADIAQRTVGNSKVGEIVLADELANGSGFVRVMHDRLKEWLPDAIADNGGIKYMTRILDAAHRADCKDSCYHCLRVYRNMNYHGLLDWRLGTSMLRVLADKDHVVGTDGNFDKPELEGWAEFGADIADRLRVNLKVPMETILMPNGVNVPLLRGREKRYLVIHPFWDIHAPGEDTWLANLVAKAQEIAGDDGVSFIDTFNLHRRMGWCYANILQQ